MNQRLVCITLLLILAILVSCSDPSAPASARSNVKPAAPADTHVLVQVSLDGESLDIVTETLVDAPMQVRRGPAPEGRWRYTALDASGALLFEGTVANPQLTRATFAAIDGPAEGVHFETSDPVSLVVRVPMADFDSLRLWDEAGELVAETIGRSDP